VRVQEDKIVEVDQSAVSQSHVQSPLHTQSTDLPSASKTQIPSIDPTILNHAATDFETPVYSDTGGQEQYAHTSPSPITGEPLMTDEISDQYRYYNVNAAYHR
jgi:hypothetical protein